jgi:hypothetical protein
MDESPKRNPDMPFNRKTNTQALTPRTITAGLLLLTAFLVAFFFKTWCGMQCIRTGYNINEIMNRQQELINTQKRLKIELVHLNSEDVLMRLAKEKFGLTIPEPDQVILLP